MSKSRACFSSAVCCSEAFEALPLSARLLYYQLNFEADIVGEVVGARRVARGYGFADADIEALSDSGLILDRDGRVFIRHHFEHNRLVNESQRRAASHAVDNAPDWLRFEGDEFKSPYCPIR